MDGKIDVNITFDDNNQIRVLSADKFRETENLKGECIDFLKSKPRFPAEFAYRDHELQRDGFNSNRVAGLSSSEDRRGQAEGSWCQEQDRR